MDDHVAFERQLTRRAQLRSGDAATPQLARILQDVATRRARRGAAPPASPGSAVARATGPTGAADAVWSVETVATDVRIIRTGRPAGLQFRAGQYLKLGVPGNRSGSYSIASAPHDPHLEFCVELIAGGRLSPALFALRPGDPVTLTDRAKGGFVLATAPCHLMVATVTGIAPLRSMLRDALAPRNHGRIHRAARREPRRRAAVPRGAHRTRGRGPTRALPADGEPTGRRAQPRLAARFRVASTTSPAASPPGSTLAAPTSTRAATRRW